VTLSGALGWLLVSSEVSAPWTPVSGVRQPPAEIQHMQERSSSRGVPSATQSNADGKTKNRGPVGASSYTPRVLPFLASWQIS